MTGGIDSDDLGDAIETLQNRVDDAEARLDAASAKRDQLQEDVWDLEDALEDERRKNEQLRERLEALEADLGDKQRGKREKHAAVIRYADNSPKGRVGSKVTPAEAAGASGSSERHAYQMVEDMAELYPFCSLEREPKKALLVDFQERALDEALGVVHGRSVDGD